MNERSELAGRSKYVEETRRGGRATESMKRAKALEQVIPRWNIL